MYDWRGKLELNHCHQNADVGIQLNHEIVHVKQYLLMLANLHLNDGNKVKL